MNQLLAVLLAVVFAWAAGAKLAARPDTAAGFASLGLPAPEAMVWVMIGLEIAIAALLVIVPGWGSLLAFAVLAGFTVFLVGLVRSGRPVSCRCFGGASTEPVSGKTLIRNGLLLALAAVVALTA